MAVNEIEVLNKLAVEYVFAYRRYVALKELKRTRELTQTEKSAFESAKARMKTSVLEIKRLGFSSKGIAEALHSAVVSVNKANPEANMFGRKVTIGEVVRSVGQFLSVDEILNNDQRLRSLSLGIVKTSHNADILAKQCAFYGGYAECFEEEEKLDGLIASMNDEYINPELVKKSIQMSTGYFNRELLEEYGLPVDGERLSEIVLGEKREGSTEITGE